MPNIRARFTVAQVIDKGSSKQIVLQPQYDNTIPEEQRASKTIPAGRIDITVDNSAMFEQFIPDKPFYVDFTPA